MFCPTINGSCVGEDCRDWCKGQKTCWHTIMWAEEMKMKSIVASEAHDYHELSKDIRQDLRQNEGGS